MKFFVIRNWRTSNLHTVKKEDGKVRVGWYVSPNFTIDPASITDPLTLWNHNAMTDEEVEELKRRFMSESSRGRITILPNEPVEYEYIFKSEREREEANKLIAKVYSVPPYMIWGGARGNGKMTRSQEIARRMQQLAGNGNVYWASKDGTLEEYLDRQPPPPSGPKLDRRKKKRK